MEKIFLGKYRIQHRMKLIRFALKALWYALRGYELTVKAESETKNENNKCVHCGVLLTNTVDIICVECNNLATLNIEKPHNTNSNKCWCNPTIINPFESEAQNGIHKEKSEE